MILREISVGTVYNSKYDFIYESTICMTELFSRLIYKYKWHTPARKIIIWIREDYTFHNRLAGGIYEKEVIFNFNYFLDLEELDRRKYIIELIKNSLVDFSKKYDLSIESILKTAYECKELEYKNIWILGNKKYASPLKLYNVQIQCEWKEDLLNVNLLIYNKLNILIQRIEWFSIESRVGYKIYEYKGEFVGDDTFRLSNQYHYQKWQIDLTNFLKNL